MTDELYREMADEVARLRMAYGSDAELHVMALCREFGVEYDAFCAYEEQLLDGYYSGPQGVWAGGEWV